MYFERKLRVDAGQDHAFPRQLGLQPCELVLDVEELSAFGDEAPPPVQLPGVVRIGRRVLIREDALLDWLRQKSTPSLEGR